MVAAYWAALAVVLASAVGTYVYFSRYGDEERWVSHTQQVMTAIEETGRLVVDAESAVRGFVVTGRPEFLAPYDRSSGVARERFEDVARLTVDNPRQQERVAALRPIIARRMQTLADVVRLQRERRQVAAARAVADGVGNELSERIRAALADMRHEEETLFRERLLRAESTSWRVNLGLVVGHTIAVLLTTLAGFALYRQLSRRREADLAATQQARLVSVLNELPVGVLVADRDGHVQFGNRTLEQIFEHPLPDAVDPPEWRLFHPDGSPYARDDVPLQRVVQTGGTVYEEELRVRRKNGDWLTLLAGAAPLRDADGTLTGAVAVFAELARTARRMEDVRQEARFRELFMSVLGHDLRNPLSVILTGARSMSRRDSLSPEQQKVLTRMISSAERMARMIDELMDFSRIRLSGGIRIEGSAGDLGEVCRAVIEEFEVTHPERRFVFTAEGDLRGKWDRDRLAQVFSNLIGNAVQHGDDRPIEITARGDGPRVVVEVANQGRPIPAELLPSIFDPFRRSATGAATGGLGLGLYIARQIVLSHGGTIDVRSREGLGTTFRVELPRQPPS